MSEKTSIAWTNATWNPTTGCSRVSEGCRACYIERTPPFRMAGRKFVNGTTGVLLHEDRLDKPLTWRKPRRIFVNSLSDLFHEDIPDDFIQMVFDVMLEADQHTYQILTKRPERMQRWVTEYLHLLQPVIIEHIWLGVSVEDQQTADERIPILLQTPAAARWISAEPLLGAVNIMPYTYYGSKVGSNVGLQWVVAGGESGPGARPCDLAWIRSIVEQCQAAGVACFVKQLGAKPEVSNGHHLPDRTLCGWNNERKTWDFPLKDKKGGDITEFPEDLRVRESPR